MPPLFEKRSQPGAPERHGNLTITPFSEAVILRIPRTNTVGIWNRPSAVLVQEDGGREWVLPIWDVTRIAQVVLAGIAVGTVAAALAGYAYRTRRVSNG